MVAVYLPISQRILAADQQYFTQFFFFLAFSAPGSIDIAYRTADGRPWVLPVVKKTEIKIAESDVLDHEYLPVCGTDSFTNASVTLLLGEESAALKEKRAFGVQSLSGTGALRLGAEFLSIKLKRNVVYYSDPTWGKWKHPGWRFGIGRIWRKNRNFPEKSHLVLKIFWKTCRISFILSEKRRIPPNSVRKRRISFNWSEKCRVSSNFERKRRISLNFVGKRRISSNFGGKTSNFFKFCQKTSNFFKFC